ncbi:hypothetical protein [Streptomyces sp. x-19]|uniref:hypothetical protein n=1 Tax=Streptomyces sp. x-19 TaxID=2789280 RepID=UPI00397FAC58
MGRRRGGTTGRHVWHGHPVAEDSSTISNPCAENRSGGQEGKATAEGSQIDEADDGRTVAKTDTHDDIEDGKSAQ